MGLLLIKSAGCLKALAYTTLPGLAPSCWRARFIRPAVETGWVGPFTPSLHNGLQFPRVCTSSSKEAVGPQGLLWAGQHAWGRLAGPWRMPGGQSSREFNGSDGGQGTSGPPGGHREGVRRADAGGEAGLVQARRLRCPAGLRELSSEDGSPLALPPWHCPNGRKIVLKKTECVKCHS